MRKKTSFSKRSGGQFPRGVIKIKKGYNPNSSSIGTVVLSFPFAYIALSAILALCAAFIGGKNRRGK